MMNSISEVSNLTNIINFVAIFVRPFLVLNVALGGLPTFQLYILIAFCRLQCTGLICPSLHQYLTFSMTFSWELVPKLHWQQLWNSAILNFILQQPSLSDSPYTEWRWEFELPIYKQRSDYYALPAFQGKLHPTCIYFLFLVIPCFPPLLANFGKHNTQSHGFRVVANFSYQFHNFTCFLIF